MPFVSRDGVGVSSHIGLQSAFNNFAGLTLSTRVALGQGLHKVVSYSFWQPYGHELSHFIGKETKAQRNHVSLVVGSHATRKWPSVGCTCTFLSLLQQSCEPTRGSTRIFTSHFTDENIEAGRVTQRRVQPEARLLTWVPSTFLWPRCLCY